MSNRRSHSNIIPLILGSGKKIKAAATKIKSFCYADRFCGARQASCHLDDGCPAQRRSYSQQLTYLLHARTLHEADIPDKMIAITMNEIQSLAPSRHPLHLANATMTNRRGRRTWDTNMGVMERWVDMKLASAGAVLWHHVQEGLKRSEHAEANSEQLQVRRWSSKASP